MNSRAAETFAELARKKALSILEPDPNHPDDDSFMLHFPKACELVEGREFWLNHLSELLAEFAQQAASEITQAPPEPGADWMSLKLKLALAEAEIERLKSGQAESMAQAARQIAEANLDLKYGLTLSSEQVLAILQRKLGGGK